VNLTRYHGVFAPNHRLRARIVPTQRGRGAADAAGQVRATPKHVSMSWAQRLKRGTENRHRASKVPFGTGVAERPQAPAGHHLRHGKVISSEEVDVPPDEWGESREIGVLSHQCHLTVWCKQSVDNFDHKARQVPLRQPLIHRWRPQKPGVAIDRSKVAHDFLDVWGPNMTIAHLIRLLNPTGC
jgi:hypothetical protein